MSVSNNHHDRYDTSIATRRNAAVRVWHDLTTEQSDDFAGGLSRL